MNIELRASGEREKRKKKKILEGTYRNTQLCFCSSCIDKDAVLTTKLK